MDRNEKYVDVREIHPHFEKRECWNCGHEWTQTHKTKNRRLGTFRPLKYGICPECHWTGDEEISA